MPGVTEEVYRSGGGAQDEVGLGGGFRVVADSLAGPMYCYRHGSLLATTHIPVVMGGFYDTSDDFFTVVWRMTCEAILP